MTNFQKELLNIVNTTTTSNKKSKANHIYLKQGCAELRAQLSEQKKGKHWKKVDGKRVWY